jgi:helix-turn-helix protein
MGYARKKSKKKRIKHLNADSERETIKENEIRTIKMDCANCKLIIIRQNKKKIIVDVCEDIMSVQREQQMQTSNLPENDEREY